MNKKALETLIDLRKEKELTQQAVAEFFGIKNYNTVSQWENGVATPPKRRRTRFIGYLWYQLGLKADEQRFSAVWNDIMEALWGWEPLSPEEKTRLGIQDEPPTQATAQLFSVPDKLPYALLGRDELVQEVKLRLFTHTQVALYGAPGIGKTALALALAYDKHIQSHFHDGIVWITLGQHADVLAELNRLGAILGVSAHTLSDPTDIHVWVQAIATAIGGRSLLFIIDDAWQSEEALAFRFSGQNCAYMVTTRNPDIAVHFANEHIFELPELSEADGLALLSRIVPPVVKHYAPFAKALVTAVGALPIALVLVGNYLRIQSLRERSGRLPEAIFQRLQQASELLRIEQPQAPIAQHPSLPKGAKISVAALVHISDEALEPPAKALLRILSIFPAKPNTFSEAAALAVSMMEVTSLQQLREYGLIERTGHERFTVHQLIHDYAALGQSYPFVTDRLIAYFARFTISHKAEYALLEQEHQNVLAAIESAEQLELHSAVLTLASALSDYLELRGFYSLATVHLNRALHAAQALKSTSGEITILNALGRIERHLGNYKVARAHFQAGLVLAQAHEDVLSVCDFYRNLGGIAYFQGDYQEAERYWKNGLPLAIRLQDKNHISAFYTNLGALAYNRNDFREAKSNYQQGLTLAREIGNVEREAGILQNLANTAKRVDDYAKAEAYYQEGYLLAKQEKLQAHLCQMLLGLGSILIQRGVHAQARPYMLEAVELARAMQHRENLCNALQYLGFIALQLKDTTSALQSYQEAVTIATEIGHPELLGMALYSLSRLEMDTGHYAEAQQHITACLAVANQTDFPFIWVNIQTIQGDWYLAKYELEQAHQTYQAAYDTAQHAGYPQLEALALQGLARVAHANNDVVAACQLGQEALAIFQRIGHAFKDDVAQWLTSIGCTV